MLWLKLFSLSPTMLSLPGLLKEESQVTNCLSAVYIIACYMALPPWMYTCQLVGGICMVGYLQISVTILRMCQCLCLFICNVIWLWCHFVGIVFDSDVAMTRHRGCVLECLCSKYLCYVTCKLFWKFGKQVLTHVPWNHQYDTCMNMKQ